MIKSVHIGKNYCIEQVVVNGNNIIHPWGIETADAWAFFTQEWGGYHHQILEQLGDVESLEMASIWQNSLSRCVKVSGD